MTRCSLGRQVLLMYIVQVCTRKNKVDVLLVVGVRWPNLLKITPSNLRKFLTRLKVMQYYTIAFHKNSKHV